MSFENALGRAPGGEPGPVTLSGTDSDIFRALENRQRRLPAAMASMRAAPGRLRSRAGGPRRLAPLVPPGRRP